MGPIICDVRWSPPNDGVGMKLSSLHESGPQFKTLKDAQVKLTDDERQKVMAAKAVWHKGHDGAESPAIKKAVIRGKTYYFSNTHRCFMVAKTIKKAVKDYFETVKPSS